MMRLAGLNGSNPLEFMAALGLLGLITRRAGSATLAFADDGSFAPQVSFSGSPADLAALVHDDAVASAGPQPWRLEYEKIEKNGLKVVSDLKAPPEVFLRFLSAARDGWIAGHGDGAQYAAAYGTSTAVDGKGNTKPTAFHFTAANQQFLKAVELSRAAVDQQWVEEALFVGKADRPGSNLRWDPSAERSRALMAANPNDDGTSVNAPLEWLAFRALPLFSVFPRGQRAITLSVHGHGDDMAFRWPLWSVAITYRAVRSLLIAASAESATTLRRRGVFSICTSTINRTGSGFGNFAPASIN